MRDGPAAALSIVDQLKTRPTLQRYHLLPAVRADLLAKLDRTEEARADYQRTGRPEHAHSGGAGDLRPRR